MGENPNLSIDLGPFSRHLPDGEIGKLAIHLRHLLKEQPVPVMEIQHIKVEFGGSWETYPGDRKSVPGMTLIRIHCKGLKARFLGGENIKIRDFSFDFHLKFVEEVLVPFAPPPKSWKDFNALFLGECKLALLRAVADKNSQVQDFEGWKKEACAVVPEIAQI